MKKITDWITNKLATLGYLMFVIKLMLYSLFASFIQAFETASEQEMDNDFFYPHKML